MLEKNYNAKDVEQRLYKRAEENGYYEADPKSSKPPFAILMPPPNVTGTLHVGHALDNTLPDAVIRRARMQGHDALYQPGTDHASIAVHVVLDGQMRKEGKSRFDLGREKFLKEAWAWTEKSQGTIGSQMRRLGVSASWRRQRFTMDEGCSKAVKEAFVTLHEKGLVYRGERLVNWDPNMQTAVSDLEVKHKEVQGSFWHIKYPLANGEFITIATTRPETMLGDTALAVNPKDERYAHLVGQQVELPLCDRKIPVVADDYVDPEFGSGIVKITPAHDFNDFEVGKRHDLPIINILTPEAKINENAPKAFVGMDRFEARKAVVKALEEQGFLEKVEPHVHSVGHAERDETILEPLLTKQWFINTKPMAEKCLKALEGGEIKFVNNRDEREYRRWLENIQDWCISRQLWWGHRVPAWHHENGDIYVGKKAPEGDGWSQDTDILDTWFSSALWPFSTQGWPEDTEALEKYYPQAAIMPGRDILFFWVIRMMMMSLELNGKVPFKTIYTHAMVLDEQGQKMSKTKGNVIDPILLMDKYGTDALRYTLVAQSALGQDIRLSEATVEPSRNFCTKIWNATRFAMMNGAAFDPSFEPASVKHLFNRAIIATLGDVLKNVDSAFDEYRFNDVGHQIYQFTWNLYCDWYLELTKPIMYGDDEALKAETRATMGYVLEKLMRMMHPIMPFISEEIWLKLTEDCRDEVGETLSLASWPTADMFVVDDAARNKLDKLMQIISVLRNIRAENNVPPKAEIKATVRGADDSVNQLLADYEDCIKFLTRVYGFKAHTGKMAKTDVAAVALDAEIILPLEGVVDFEAEKQRLEKEIAKNQAELDKLQGMLSNPNFVERAPSQLVEENKSRRDELAGHIDKLKATYEARC